MSHNVWGFNNQNNNPTNYQYQLLQSAAALQQHALAHRLVHAQFVQGCQQCIVLYNLSNNINAGNVIGHQMIGNRNLNMNNNNKNHTNMNMNNTNNNHMNMNMNNINNNNMNMNMNTNNNNNMNMNMNIQPNIMAALTTPPQLIS